MTHYTGDLSNINNFTSGCAVNDYFFRVRFADTLPFAFNIPLHVNICHFQLGQSWQIS